MRVEQFAEALAFAVQQLRRDVDRDWSVKAGALNWTCRETAEHVADVLFAYALQLAARAQSKYLPYEEMKATREAGASDLVDGIAATGSVLRAVMTTAAPDTRAWHPLGLLSTTEWAGLAANELLVHTFDISTGLQRRFEPPRGLSTSALRVMRGLHSRRESDVSGDPWFALLELSGRQPPAGAGIGSGGQDDRIDEAGDAEHHASRGEP